MFKEKRKHKRIPIKQGIYAVVKPEDGRMGQIINISEGGLMMRYIDGVLKDPHPCTVEITYPLKKIVFDHIPVASAKEVVNKEQNCISHYLRVEFAALNMEQFSFINYVARSCRLKRRLKDLNYWYSFCNRHLRNESRVDTISCKRIVLTFYHFQDH